MNSTTIYYSQFERQVKVILMFNQSEVLDENGELSFIKLWDRVWKNIGKSPEGYHIEKVALWIPRAVATIMNNAKYEPSSAQMESLKKLNK